jgi:hypothetical protein
MPSPSLAEQVLDLSAQLRAVIMSDHENKVMMSSSTLVGLLTGLRQLEEAAERRLYYSENERARRL